MEIRKPNLQFRLTPKPILIAPLVVTVVGILSFLIADTIIPFHPNITYSTMILDDDGEILHAFLSEDEKWRLYLSQDEISTEFEKAILYKEDQYFWYHPGVNPFAIVRAIFQNTSSGKRKSGASTITMQVARLLNPKPRTYSSKLIEMFNALQLEWHYDKEEILRMYLNLLPYGGNIEGVKSAAGMYFGKDPELLSLAEITGLVAIPNKPSSLSIQNDHQPINNAKNLWLERFSNGHVFAQDEIEIALSEELKPRRQSLPREAPHLSSRLKRRYADRSIIQTFISAEKQRRVAETTRSYVDQLLGKNVTNASVLVVNNATRQVIAYVGSSNFYDNQHAGQVDGIKAIRSPGSTLKPLLYGLHFDQGTLTPKRRLADVRTDFQGYQPVNYTNTFSGWISAEQALKESLNVPAVKLLNEYGIDAFTETLIRSRFSTIERMKEHLGLSLILGGCGTTLEELTGLYSSLANSGQFEALKLSVHQKEEEPQTVLSPESSYMLTDILVELTRPDFPDSWKNNPNQPRIAWKTGTSFGRRDAWSIGYNKDYTVGVWAGNFSGEGAPDLSGADIAAPLLFKVFNTISQNANYDWYQPTPKVNFKWVCDETGLEPNHFCKHIVEDMHIKGVTNSTLCEHLQPVFIAKDSSESYCQTCLHEAKSHKEAFFPNHSPVMISFFQKNNIAQVSIPDHYPFCERVFPDQGLKIISPVNRLEYFVDKRDSDQLKLVAEAPGNATKFFWYVDDVFLKAASRNEDIYFTPREGRIKISCSDDRGRNQDIFINVKKVGF